MVDFFHSLSVRELLTFLKLPERYYSSSKHHSMSTIHVNLSNYSSLVIDDIILKQLRNQIMATRDIIGPIALLFESLENLFRGIVKAVDEQYTKSNVDFTGPLPTVIFIHLTIILMNAICILFGLLFRAEYFMKCSVGMFLDELQKVQIQYLGAETNNFPTLLFNYVHQHFHCCGMNDYTEWLNSTIKWKRMVTYDNTTYGKFQNSCYFLNNSY
ncbi:uncharacterized protein DC041_0007705 [Schistosoma bovis]|uniref:Uncharacterized protein n=1 Tax=Schistosoma bovis TaxID=6184 RepID=A0A430Q1C7_SCHBO|nr:uncharacterized protein DC041_0007705 [Schistosoma bovis]